MAKKAKKRAKRTPPKPKRYPCKSGPLCPTECSGSHHPDGRCHWAKMLSGAYWR